MSLTFSKIIKFIYNMSSFKVQGCAVYVYFYQQIDKGGCWWGTSNSANSCLQSPMSLFFHFQVYKLPLSITMTHLVTKFILSLTIREIIEKISGIERTTLNWRQYFFRVAPPGIKTFVSIIVNVFPFYHFIYFRNC